MWILQVKIPRQESVRRGGTKDAFEKSRPRVQSRTIDSFVALADPMWIAEGGRKNLYGRVPFWKFKRRCLLLYSTIHTPAFLLSRSPNNISVTCYSVWWSPTIPTNPRNMLQVDTIIGVLASCWRSSLTDIGKGKLAKNSAWIPNPTRWTSHRRHLTDWRWSQQWDGWGELIACLCV